VNPLHSSRIVCALLAALGLAVISCGESPPTDQVQPMESAELAERIRGGNAPVIVDVRSRGEYAAGHIPGAVNIPVRQLPKRLDDLVGDKIAEVVVYCQRGTRSASAAKVLVRAGYTNVRELEGHMRDWRQAGHPTQ
jgi:rhodanese-related sulfurtransferase